jgi:outer membrane protein TolC
VQVVPSTAEAPNANGIARLDLAAVDHRLDALARQRTALALGFLPELDLYGRVVYSDNDALVDDTWLEGGLRATWTPLARGTRVPRIASLSAQRRAAEHQRRSLELQIDVDIERASAGLRTATRGVDVQTRALAQAEQAAQVIGDRYGQGLATLTDLLQVQAERRQALAALRVAEIDVHRQQIEARWAHGVL